jgi:hypothetical protein
MITPERFHTALREHLDGLPLAKALSCLTLPTDGQGNIQPHIVGNLQKLFRVAIRNSPLDIVKRGSEKMLEFLGE